ncbi:MAG: fluoride efflux transporter CrcB [Fimbriimonadaceae bacterium]|nr:fluoride efflux transporter CrcB [Fimbriimonadaceae bacterium]
METITKIALVGSGGFLGANVRYWLGGWIQDRTGGAFPWQTMFINVTGSLAIGLFMGLFAGLDWSPNWRLFLAIGVFGGYTTYSTFAYEAVAMLGDGRYLPLLLYVEGTAVLTVVGAWLGLVTSRLLLGGVT